MWMLQLLPDGILEFVVNAVLISGVILTFLSFFVLNRILRLIPGLANYHTLLQVVSVVILSAGLYFKGGYSTEMRWREEVAKVQAELEVAKNKAAEVVTQVEQKVVFRDKVIKEQGQNIIQFVDREVVKREEVVKFIENCPIPAEIINVHNQAAKLNEAAKGQK